MLMWLRARRTRKGAPNENYARELMELFTLGAGSGYTERDVREQARALTGWTNEWRRRRRPRQLPLRQELHDTGRRDLRQARHASTGGRVPALPRAHRPSARSSSSKLWSYFIPTRADAATRDGARARSTRSDYDIRPRGGGDPPPPRALHRAADGEAAGRLHRRAAARARARHRHRRRGSGSPTWPASASSSRRTSRAGTTAAGSTPRPSGAVGGVANYALERDAARRRQGPRARCRDREALVERAIAFWGNPTLGPRHTARSSPSPKRAQRRPRTRAGRRRPTRCWSQNALRMLVATSPDFQTC